MNILWGLLRWHSGKECACQCRRCKRHRFSSWVGMIWRRKWQPTPVFLPGKFPGLAGYSPWSRKESDTIEWLCTRARTYMHISLCGHFHSTWLHIRSGTVTLYGNIFLRGTSGSDFITNREWPRTLVYVPTFSCWTIGHAKGHQKQERTQLVLQDPTREGHFITREHCGQPARIEPRNSRLPVSPVSSASGDFEENLSASSHSSRSTDIYGLWKTGSLLMLWIGTEPCCPWVTAAGGLGQRQGRTKHLSTFRKIARK